jgi:hypothetical protein
MAHPYHHALSSAKTKKFKCNNWKTHFPLHNWLDSSKFAFADARHRSLFHNPAGVLIATKLFKNIKNAKQIATQHISEDMGNVYTINKWLPREYWPQGSNPHKLRVSLNINPKLNPTNIIESLLYQAPFPKTLLPQIKKGLNLLLSPEKTEDFEIDDPRRFFFFSSVGPYLCEQLLGPTITPTASSKNKTPKALATRSVFEYFIQETWGLIPSHQDIMANRPIEDWMWKKAKPLSKEL